MAKGKSIKQEIAARKRQVTREAKKRIFDAVCAKGKVENAQDILGVFYGLSRKAIERAACYTIIYYARFGYTPKEIMERMEDKK
jgi:methylase of polypeptide subunit release factors